MFTQWEQQQQQNCIQAQGGLWDPISIYENLCDIWMTTSYFCFSIWVSILSSLLFIIHHLLDNELLVFALKATVFSILWKRTGFYCSAAPAKGGPQLLHALGGAGSRLWPMPRSSVASHNTSHTSCNVADLDGYLSWQPGFRFLPSHGSAFLGPGVFSLNREQGKRENGGPHSWARPEMGLTLLDPHSTGHNSVINKLNFKIGWEIKHRSVPRRKQEVIW